MPKGGSGDKMKLLIVSDSHGRWQTLRELAERERPDRVLHLGDVLGDARRLADACPGLPVESVAGNCDGWTAAGETDRILFYEGVRFFLTHGHTYHVKSGLGLLIRAGEESGAGAVLFGHTHKALCEQMPGGMWLVNPGTVGGVYARATYAVAEAAEGVLSVRIKQV